MQIRLSNQEIIAAINLYVATKMPDTKLETFLDELGSVTYVDEDAPKLSEKVEIKTTSSPDKPENKNEDIFFNTSNGTALRVENSSHAAEDTPTETPVQKAEQVLETAPQSTETTAANPPTKEMESSSQPVTSAPTNVPKPSSLFAHLSDPHRKG